MTNSQKIILETRRLFLREMVEADIPDIAEILQDPRVVYAYGHDFTDADILTWYLRQVKRYVEHGFGLWAAISKSSGEMVGQAGLTMQPYMGAQILEVGYLLKFKFWHNGYAREAAASCRDYAFNVLNAKKVYSIIKTDNFPSVKVAESIGMVRENKFVARYYAGDMEHYLYSISNSHL